MNFCINHQNIEESEKSFYHLDDFTSIPILDEEKDNQISLEKILSDDFCCNKNFKSKESLISIQLKNIFKVKNNFSNIFFQNKTKTFGQLFNENFIYPSTIKETKTFLIKKYYFNGIPIIFKISNTGHKFLKDESIHESIVGLYGTNILRELGIPNFVYIYAFFENNSNNPKSYILYEYISGLTYHEFIKDCSLEEFLCTFAQIILALKKSYILLDFTHYDLHTANIIVKNTNITSIKYNNVICKTCNKIPVIIDYGTSHIKLNGTHCGNLNSYMIRYQVFQDRSFPMHDVYKLLFYCVFNILHYNSKIKKQIIPLLSFFTKIEATKIDYDELFDELNLQEKIYYPIPYSKETANIEQNEWDEFKDKYNLPNNYNPVHCNINLSLDDFIEFFFDFCNSVNIYPLE